MVTGLVLPAVAYVVGAAVVARQVKRDRRVAVVVGAVALSILLLFPFECSAAVALGPGGGTGGAGGSACRTLFGRPVAQLNGPGAAAVALSVWLAATGLVIADAVLLGRRQDRRARSRGEGS